MPTPFIDRLEAIRGKLIEANRRNLQPFGSGGPLRLYSPLRESIVDAFEKAHGVTLPADYRAFLTYLADGSSGPAYGLLTLADAMRAEGYPRTTTQLQSPFPFTEATDAQHFYDPATDKYAPRSGTLTLCNEGAQIRGPDDPLLHPQRPNRQHLRRGRRIQRALRRRRGQVLGCRRLARIGPANE